MGDPYTNQPPNMGCWISGYCKPTAGWCLYGSSMNSPLIESRQNTIIRLTILIQAPIHGCRRHKCLDDHTILGALNVPPRYSGRLEATISTVALPGHSHHYWLPMSTSRGSRPSLEPQNHGRSTQLVGDLPQIFMINRFPIKQFIVIY